MLNFSPRNHIYLFLAWALQTWIGFLVRLQSRTTFVEQSAIVQESNPHNQYLLLQALLEFLSSVKVQQLPEDLQAEVSHLLMPFFYNLRRQRFLVHRSSTWLDTGSIDIGIARQVWNDWDMCITSLDVIRIAASQWKMASTRPLQWFCRRSRWLILSVSI